MNGINQKTSWEVHSSFCAKNTINPIRQIVDGLNLTPNKDKEVIPLSIGDPTVYGNLKLSSSVENAVLNSLQSNITQWLWPFSRSKDCTLCGCHLRYSKSYSRGCGFNQWLFRCPGTMYFMPGKFRTKYLSAKTRVFSLQDAFKCQRN